MLSWLMLDILQHLLFFGHFLVSLTFCNYILGLTGADEAISSQRAQGCARESYLTKRRLQQRPPLRVEYVKALEIYVSDMAGSARDVYAAGCFLLCIYMRARFSDMQHMTDIIADEVHVNGRLCGYIESKVTRSKSAYTTERKTMLLPMASPLIGVSGRNWFAKWQQARVECAVPRGEGLPLLPQPAANGWLRIPMTAASGGDWLRKILHAHNFSREQVDRIGTHSCKATCLSWLAKAGVDLASRRLLGYHVDPATKTCLVYSRDAVSGPLRELDRIIGLIHNLEFDPDSTRSGYFNVPVGEPDRAQNLVMTMKQMTLLQTRKTRKMKSLVKVNIRHLSLQLTRLWASGMNIQLWKVSCSNKSPHYFRTRTPGISMYVQTKPKCIFDAAVRSLQAIPKFPQGPNSFHHNAELVSNGTSAEQKNIMNHWRRNFMGSVVMW